MKVIVVGAGIIGSLTAYRLARKGADVTLIDASQAASAASGASFGWINASFFLDENHFKLRHSAFDAYSRLEEELNTTIINKQGCIWWDNTPNALDAQYDTLKTLNYNVNLVEGDQLKALEPQVSLPNRALLCPDEASVDLVALVEKTLNVFQKLGGRLIAGVPVTGITENNGKVKGVQWSGGEIKADQVVLATGVTTEKLLSSLGLYLPMLDRPGLILRSAPLPPLLSHILAVPGQELRQDCYGCLIAPTAAAHQSDTTDRIEEDPTLLADQTILRLNTLLQREITWQKITLAYRPVPEDGRPVLGAYGPDGLYVSTMHSGATLAPLVAEYAATEILTDNLDQESLELIKHYRPNRFLPS